MLSLATHGILNPQISLPDHLKYLSRTMLERVPHDTHNKQGFNAQCTRPSSTVVHPPPPSLEAFAHLRSLQPRSVHAPFPPCAPTPSVFRYLLALRPTRVSASGDTMRMQRMWPAQVMWSWVLSGSRHLTSMSSRPLAESPPKKGQLGLRLRTVGPRLAPAVCPTGARQAVPACLLQSRKLTVARRIVNATAARSARCRRTDQRKWKGEETTTGQAEV